MAGAGRTRSQSSDGWGHEVRNGKGIGGAVQGGLPPLWWAKLAPPLTSGALGEWEGLRGGPPCGGSPGIERPLCAQGPTVFPKSCSLGDAKCGREGDLHPFPLSEWEQGEKGPGGAVRNGQGQRWEWPSPSGRWRWTGEEGLLTPFSNATTIHCVEGSF